MLRHRNGTEAAGQHEHTNGRKQTCFFFKDVHRLSPAASTKLRKRTSSHRFNMSTLNMH